MRALTSTQLRGVWAAVPTPWTEDYQLDVGTLDHNIQRYQSVGAKGVYTTDSDGEFYAIELDEFRTLAKAFGRSMEKTSMDAAMGVTWCNTQGMIDRMNISIDAGIPNFHVAFPFWMPLASSDVPRFFEDLANAVPEARWIHYRTPRSHILPSGVDYARYQIMYPEQLIGTKLGTTDIIDLTEIVTQSPMLAHTVFELTVVMASLAGARGNCSYWINTLPKWTLQTWELCEQHRWDEAMARQAKLNRWDTEVVYQLTSQGHNHAILGKAGASLSGFIRDSGVTCAPYYRADPTLVQKIKKQFVDFWAEELAQEEF